MNIGIHDAEMQYFGKLNKFPNYAIMKISAYHKSKGDTVSWWLPMNNYDVVYSSKIFEFTPENKYLPPGTIKGGTGYGMFSELPEEIDEMFPDYTIYPKCDYAIGYLTRGCINNCRWCVVPRKEGMIKPYRKWQDIVRNDTKKLVLMDNNILACDYGIQQLDELSHTGYEIDINQGMDIRLVTSEIMNIIYKIKFKKYIRFSCDQQCQIKYFFHVAEMFKSKNISTSKMFVYFLVTKDEKEVVHRLNELKKIKGITIYAQPEKNPGLGIMPERWQNVFAQKYIYSGQWRKKDWYEYKRENNHFFKMDGGKND